MIPKDKNLSVNNQNNTKEENTNSHNLIESRNINKEKTFNSDSEDFHPRSKKKKKPSDKRLKIILKSLPHFKRLQKSNSKYELVKFFERATDKGKKIIKFYLSECFLIDIFSRKLSDKKLMMSKRQLFYDSVDNPKLLLFECKYDNNLLKNFSAGLINFLFKNFFKIQYQIYKTENIVHDAEN